MSLRAVDLNFGCPSPEIIKIGAGPALLKRRNPLREIFAVLKRWKARTSLPIGAVTAKIRLGLNRAELDQKIFLPLVDLANEFLDALTVHARHAREPSSAPARWEAIAEVKRRASIPIIGNGDGTSAEAARNLMRETGCDGVLIARGAIRSPWIFRELASQGSGFPTIDEIDAAEARWNQRATELESKSKYFEWHTEGFQRMRARARGEKPTTEHLPPETG